MRAVEVCDLRIRYGDRTAVDGVSFEADHGEVLALLGPNGAGKTSTVEAMEGYRRPSGGSVRVLGLDPIRHRRQLAPRIGVMLQAGGVYPTMAAGEVLRLFASYYERPIPPADLMARLGLDHVVRTPWRRLSGGEQQRLSLALALVGRPEVVFLDEPTAGIDPQGRLTVRQVVSDLRASGVCVVLTTHELQEAEQLADRVAIVDHGQVVAIGTVAELTGAQAGGTLGIRFGAPPGMNVGDLAAALGAPVDEHSPGQYRVGAASTPALIGALAEWLARHDHTLTDLHAGGPSLEDVFLRLTGSADGEAPR